MQVKKTWQQVDGVLLLDKPLGLTSNDALQKVRRLFSAAKGGHTGTLDPLATGLLPLCFGEATKFSADLLDADKTYEAVVRLGVTTDSGDADGAGDRECYGRRQRKRCFQACCRLSPATYCRCPPCIRRSSATAGPFYELARQGIEVEREARAVTIHGLDCP
jgi:tRNA pseudouridine55 synthase